MRPTIDGRYDAIVIGAGIVGAAVAAELARSRRVLLLEREAAPGMHSTGRSAAIFVENYGDAAVRALTLASHPFLAVPPPGFADAPLLKRRGALVTATRDGLAALEREAERSTARRIITGEALALVPVLKPETAAAALWEEGAADIDVNALHQGFLRLLKARGGALRLGTGVEGLERAGAGWSVSSGAEDFAADIVVNAAGAWAGGIGRLAGTAEIGLEPRRRTAILVPAPAGHAIDRWPFVVDVDETLYFKPDAGHLLLSPADETPYAPCDVQPDEIDVATAAYRFEEATGLQVRRILHRWAGLRVFAPDRGPVIGFDGQAPGFFWCAGLGGFGIQTSPAVGRLAAALALGLPVPADMADAGLDPRAVAPSRAALAAPGDARPS